MSNQNNPNHPRPISFLPMPNCEFEQRLNAQIQDLILHDTEELRRITESNRESARAERKSQLRREEFMAKQAIKIKFNRIIIRDNCMIMQKFNGANVLILEQVLFRCLVEQIRRYRREGEKEELFQMILKENEGKVISPLYRNELLQSETKLRKTILSAYDCTNNAESKSEAWHQMHSELSELFRRAEVLELPSKAGWHKNVVHWHFWTARDEESLLTNEQIQKCHVRQFDGLDTESVVISLLQETGLLPSQAASLLLLRFSALLGRLTGGMSKPFGIVLVGREAEHWAKNFLSTLQTDTDVCNLDSDRLGVVREQVKKMQDSPMLFLSSDPDNKSVQNRLREVLSWLDSGYIEGVHVATPFVFCLRGFSKVYPLDGMIVFELDGQMPKQKCDSFAKIQQLVISRIEADSGWVERMRKLSENLSAEGETDEKVQGLLRVIVSILLNMFKLELSEKTFVRFEEFLRLGQEEISRQLCNRGQILVEIFKDKVVEMAEKGKIWTMERENAFFLAGPDAVYYDEEFYYFEKRALKSIRYEMGIDEKSLLYIKQQLIECGVVKLYRTNGSRRRELDVDFVVNLMHEGKEQRSGFAIRKEFWDVPGGIALFERRTMNP